MKAFKGLREKVRKGEGGFTLIELLIVIIILGILAAVVAFNVSGFLGAGTCETAKTEASSVQTGVLAGMADKSMGEIESGFEITASLTTLTIEGQGKNFTLEDYLQLPTHGNWTWSSSGVVYSGSYSGGGVTATLTNGTWSGTACD